MRVLCALEDIPNDTARGFAIGENTPQIEILVFRRGDKIYSYVNSCPHLGTPLDMVPDSFMSMDGLWLQCHSRCLVNEGIAQGGAQFRPESGLCVQGACQGRTLAPFAVEIRDGKICVG